MAKKAKVVKEKSIEDRIWDSANKLRGNLTASEYQNVVLGLVFLKYISDCFEKRYNELVAEGDGFEEDRDEYTAEHVFWVPQNARWQNIASKAHDPQIGQVIDHALEEIGKENPRLKKVMPNNYSRPEIDKIRLGEVVDLFDNMNMHTQGEGIDLFGRVYEYCLNNFAAETKQSGGEFYTPSCIVRTIVEVLQPFEGRVYDPACGSGGMFVQSAKFIQRHQGNLRNVTIYGQEFNANTWKMAHMNLAIRGLEADLGDSWGDTFGDDKHATKKFDFIMANPPFNLSDWGANRLADDVRWKYGVPPDSNANYAWIQHMIHHLSPTGKIGLVLANGALSTSVANEGEIRKAIIEADLIEGIVALPGKLFYGPNIEVSLWFLSKKKQQPGKVLFVDARRMASKVARQINEISEDNILAISEAFKKFREGNHQDVKNFCAVATIEDIRNRNYSLTPSPYINKSNLNDILEKKGWTEIPFSSFINASAEKVGENIVPEYSVTNKGIALRSEKYTNALSSSISKNKIIRRGDLIFGMSREILNWDVMQDEIGCVSPAYTVYNVDDSIIDYRYLREYIKTNIDEFKDLIKPSSREGQGIDKELLMNKVIWIPPYDQYTELVNTYKKIDNSIVELETKIEGLLSQKSLLLLNQINASIK